MHLLHHIVPVYFLINILCVSDQQEALWEKMKSLTWCIPFTLLLAGLTLPLQSAEKTSSKNIQDPEVAPFHGGSWRRQDSRGLFSHKSLQPDDDGVGLEGLSPVRLEMGPGDFGRERGIRQMRGQKHHQGGEFQRKGRKHGQEEGKRHGRKDKAHGQGVYRLVLCTDWRIDINGK